MARNPKNCPSFFKILVGERFFTSLRVPPAFLNNYLKRIKFPTESTVALKSDPEVSWKVKMEKGEGGVYFTKGWNRVSKDMKLAIGDFLIFYLVGDAAAFEIRAYDRTCCERMSRCRLSSRSETESGDDDGNNVDYDHGDEYAEKDENDNPKYVDEEEEDDGDQDEEEEEIEPDEPTSKKNESGGKLPSSEVRAVPQPRLEEFVSKYPFFQMVITRSCLHNSLMNMPMNFAKGNINRNCRKHILTFETGGGRSWPVTLSCNPQAHTNNMCGGLSTFLNENFVRVGNLCTFELVDRKQMAFRVYIYKDNNEIPHADKNNILSSNTANSSSKMSSVDMHGKLDFSNVRTPQPGSEFASNYPFFQVNITANYLSKGGLTVPWTFAESNINTECKQQIVTLETGGNGWSWPVKLIIVSYPQHRARFFDGIVTFLEENNVKAGDFCTFELVNKMNVVFRVSIYRG